MKPIHSLAFCAGLLTLSACQSQTDTLSLAGEWRFAIDSLDRGQAESWAARPLEGTLHLPGSLQEQGYGDNVSVKTPWTGQIVDQSWYTAPEYAKYREPGNIKVPFWLNPDKHYVGAAWYQRTVDIPEDWQGRPVELELERTHWTTDLYIDGKKVDSRESLQTPHRYVLPDGLAPGSHTLTLRVDNRLYVDVGINAHSVSDHTQSNWNGLIGELRLTAKPAVYVDHVRTDPDMEGRDVRLRVSLKGTVPAGGAHLQLQATTFGGTEVGQSLQVDLRSGARDLVVDAFRQVAASRGKVLAASYFGKVKTVTQMAAIVLVFLNGWPFVYFDGGWDPALRIVSWVVYLSTAASLLSMVDYLYKNRSVLKEE